MNSKFNLISVIINLINIFNVSTVNANLLDNIVLYPDSEIQRYGLTYKDIFNLHHSFVIERSKWEDGQINFKIDKKFNDDEIDKILEAMYDIERFSCVRFAAHDPRYGPDYLMITKDYVNRLSSSAQLGCLQKGEQALSLSIDMINDHQTILHELFHTIGFGHHHQRSDRDDYIEIHYENIDLTELDILMNFAPNVNFDQRVKYLTPFDFNSVMLYDEYGFSANNKSVITSKIEGSSMPTSDRDPGLSPYDVILLNRFYDCNTVDKSKSKIFYETAVEILYPKIVNYHEIQRAKDYIELNVPQDVQHEEDYIDEEIQTDGQLQDRQNTNLTSSALDRLHDESRIEENLLDGNDTNLAKNKEE